MKNLIHKSATFVTRWFLVAGLLASSPFFRCEAVALGHSVLSGLLANSSATSSDSRRSGTALGAMSATNRGTVISASFHLVPMLAQASPDQAIETFLNFLAKLFLIIGAILIAYGGYEISRGRVAEGLLSVLGGLLLALAIPIMRWLLRVGSGGV